MRALVTGASGFVGPHLCAHLRAMGDDTIDPGDEHDHFDVTDREAVDRVLARVRPDVLYHLAARSNVAASWRDPVACLRVNVEGTQNVLDAARAHGVDRVLVIGSAEEYGRVDPADLPLREDAPLRPVSPYGASKVAASYLALQACLGAGLETIRVRAFNHTGPGQRPDFFVPGLAHRIAEAERSGLGAIAAGALDAERDIGDVRDVVRAYRLLVEHGTPGEVYNVCTGRAVAIRAIADHLLGRATRPLRIETDPALLRRADLPVLVGDATRVRDATGWTPAIPLTETLDAVLAEARAAAAQGS